MKALAVICARGGSKGLPRKNVLDLGGKPVVAWSVEAAQQSKLLGHSILSSDDPEIIEAAKCAGADVPFVRPPELACDESSIYDVLFHALDNFNAGFDYVVLLQATSPLRRGEDIDACLGMCRDASAPAVVSVVRASKPPQWMYTLDARGCLLPVMTSEATIGRRQEALDCFVPNGAVYVARADWLREQRSFIGVGTRAYCMAPERSIDIDTYLDLITARAVLAEISKGAFT